MSNYTARAKAPPRPPASMLSPVRQPLGAIDIFVDPDAWTGCASGWYRIMRSIDGRSWISRPGYVMTPSLWQQIRAQIPEFKH